MPDQLSGGQGWQLESKPMPLKGHLLLLSVCAFELCVLVSCDHTGLCPTVHCTRASLKGKPMTFRGQIQLLAFCAFELWV